jgi:2-amino-4-hydroxy-6-hydroxymethyldihydropteridine diphosphokinase
MISSNVSLGLGGNVGADLETVYLGLGANLGKSPRRAIERALEYLEDIPEIPEDIECSKFYITTPVYDSPQDRENIPQDLFWNAVCRFETTLSPEELLRKTQAIQIKMGQGQKPQNAPRKIDLDIIFYGNKAVNKPDLHIPHERWNKRLFVLYPLLDLTKEIELPGGERIDIEKLIQAVMLESNEIVRLWEGDGDEDEKYPD